MNDPLTLNQALRQLNELRERLAEREIQNQELKHELEILRSQNKQNSPPEKSLTAGIDQNQNIENNILPNKDLLRRIIDTVSDLIYIKDLNGIYRGCNKASEEFVGLKESEQVGKSDFDLFEKKVAETIRDTDNRILASAQEYCIDEWVLALNGKRVLLESKKAPFYGTDGKVAGIVGISRDITARKLAEDALKKANQELDAFARTVSHDLRNPLTPIIGYAEVLREKYHGQLDEWALESLNEIISSGEEILVMMNDLLSLARVGQVKRAVIALDAGDVARAVVHNLAGQLTDAEVAVDIGDLPTLCVPKTLLFQIFENLIGNALKYGSKAGDVIYVGGKRKEDRVRLFVRDHGIGIPAEERECIFELFYRRKEDDETCGTGIGLATVQKIARIFDGHAWVEETPGGGSTFWIEISDDSVKSDDNETFPP